MTHDEPTPTLETVGGVLIGAFAAVVGVVVVVWRWLR